MTESERIELGGRIISELSNLSDIRLVTMMAEFWQGEVKVLMHLALNCDRKVYPSDISDETHLSRSRVTAILNSLRKKEFIAMSISEIDRRRMQVEITDAGMEYINEKTRCLEEYCGEIAAKCGRENTEKLIDAVRLFSCLTSDK